MHRAAAAALVLLVMAGTASAQQRERISFEGRQKGNPVTVTAEIYWPSRTGVVPAMVIHHGSGGISDVREGRWAREMSALGLAAIVIDSFKPRGVTSTVEDQSSVTGLDFNLDALKALIALGNNPRIDRSKIGIMGFSKGGTSTLNAALERPNTLAGVPAGLRYALHVPFYPSCATQYYRPRMTGAPIYMLLGANDTYVGTEPCTTYADALRAAGATIEVKIYPGAMHGFDGGRAYSVPRGENFSKCIYQQQPDGTFVERMSGVAVTDKDGRAIPGAGAKAASVCMTLGVSGGGNDAAAAQSLADLKGYVQRHLLN